MDLRFCVVFLNIGLLLSAATILENTIEDDVDGDDTIIANIESLITKVALRPMLKLVKKHVQNLDLGKSEVQGTEGAVKFNQSNLDPVYKYINSTKTMIESRLAVFNSTFLQTQARVTQLEADVQHTRSVILVVYKDLASIRDSLDNLTLKVDTIISTVATIISTQAEDKKMVHEIWDWVQLQKKGALQTFSDEISQKETEDADSDASTAEIC